MELKPQYVFRQPVNNVTGYSLVLLDENVEIQQITNPDDLADDVYPEVDILIHGRVISPTEADNIWEEKASDICIVENPLSEGTDNSNGLRYYKPLEHFAGLFRVFTEIPATPSRLLEFVQKFGFLNDRNDMGLLDQHVIVSELYGDSTPVHAELLIDWVEQIWKMHEAMNLWELARARDARNLSKYLRWSDGVLGYWTDFHGLQSEFLLVNNTRDSEGKALRYREGDVFEPAIFIASMIANEGLEGRVSPKLEMTVEDKTPRLAISPLNLLGALWLQLARAIDGDKEYRACQHCGSWFEIGSTGYSRARRFCSNRCRVAFSRARKRVQEKV
jgi:hypothetical protein